MPEIGQTISHYRITEKIGGGGMGVVYKAQDTRLKRPVALKFLHESLARDPLGMERFKREARATSALNHPGIVTIYDIDQVDGTYFIAMEYVEGQTLQELITSGELDLDQALDYAIQVSDALSKAHAAGIVHRDIKPSNLMIVDGNRAKVLDFGLAKLTDRPADPSESPEDAVTRSTMVLTQEDSVLGTLLYMSPEQARGHEVDSRSDIFSLGIVLYQMITKNLPFSGPHAAAVLDKLLHSPAPSLRSTQPHLPLALDHTIARALAKNPEDRYQNMQEMASDLRAVSSGEGPIRPAPKKKTRRTIAFTALAALALLAVLFLGFSLRQWLPFKLGGSAAPDEIVLAVLPFNNVGDDPDNQDFCDGLMERLATKFNQLGQSKSSLSIVAPTEVRSENVNSASQARSAFGATMILAGSVHRVVSNVLLTIYLVDTSSKRQIDGATFSAAAANTIELENDAFEKAVSMLDLKLTPEERQLLSAGETMNPDAHNAYLQGIAHLARFDKPENIDIAIEFFQKAVREDSMYALAHAGLGEAYWRKYQDTREPRWTEEALSSSIHAAELDSRVPRVYLTQGMVYRGTGQPEKAVEALNQAIKMEPRSAEAYRVLGRAYEAMNRIEDAEAAFNRAIQLNPRYWEFYWDLGAFYGRRTRYAEAAKYFEQVIELEPDSYQAYASLGGIYLLMGEFELAEEIFSKSIEISPSARAYSNLAASYMLQGRSKEAVPLLKKAIEMEGANYELWANLAGAYLETPGLSDMAPEALERAVELVSRELDVNPQTTLLRARRAYYLVRLGNREQALEEIAQVEKSASKDPEVLFWTAAIYEITGNREKALDKLEAAIAEGFSPAFIRAATEFVQMHNDPRYIQLLEDRSPR